MPAYRPAELLERQREHFISGATLPVQARLDALNALRDAVRESEEELCAALCADLGKGRFESYMCEVGLVLEELSYVIKHVRRWAKPRRVPTPLAQFAASSAVWPSPYGSALIMSPWNYPILLTLGPLADALAAGNTAIVKPSAYSPRCSEALAELIERCLPAELAAVVTGGREENRELLSLKFDYIFFTGSTNVAREVMRAAAEHITPMSLELGGKSPCIVTKNAKLPLAARRIVFGKFLNCGQTCVAPDFVWCDESVRDGLLGCIKDEIARQYGDMTDYGRIVNRKHFDRLTALFGDGEIYCGGSADPETLRIEPTVMTGASWDSTLMTDEIFGPILPVMTYRDISEVRARLETRPKPLAMYVFSEDGAEARKLMRECRFGGGCINDTIIHLATSEMGFGGVGESGMGSYHGKAGFDAFTHYKSIVDKKTWFDLPVRYRPYTSGAEKLLRFFLK